MSCIRLKVIPTILVGGNMNDELGFTHRYVNDTRFSSRLLPHTYAIPRMPGGHCIGASKAHAIAAEKALEYDTPVLLLEDDAVIVEGEGLILSNVPSDADIIWLGRSVWDYPEIKSPIYIPNPNSPYQKLIGRCCGSHAILLLTKKGKEVWIACNKVSSNGVLDGYVDLVGSEIGSYFCNHYILANPIFYQPDHPTTLRPLPL